MAAVGAAGAPVVLFAVLRALRAFFWGRQRKCAARKYCEGDSSAEAELRGVCASVGEALLAALRGLKGAATPVPQADAALLQQTAMTIALETQVAVREAGPAAEELLSELLSEIEPLTADGLYEKTPSASEKTMVVGAEAYEEEKDEAGVPTVAGTLRRLLPWLPAEEVMRAAAAHAVAAALPAGARLCDVARRVTKSPGHDSQLASIDDGAGDAVVGLVHLQGPDMQLARLTITAHSTAGPAPNGHRGRPLIFQARVDPVADGAGDGGPPEQSPATMPAVAVTAAANGRRRKKRKSRTGGGADANNRSTPSGQLPVVKVTHTIVDSIPRKNILDPRKIIPYATEAVSKNGCLLSLTNEPCMGCTAILNEIEQLLPTNITSSTEFLWENIQQELIWAEINKKREELFSHSEETQKFEARNILTSNDSISSISTI